MAEELHDAVPETMPSTEAHYLLHINEVDAWPRLLSNLGNLTELGLAGRVTVMMNGTSIYVLQGKHDWKNKMEAAASAGVTFEVCQRSLANHGIDPADLPDWITPIWAAVPVIAEHVTAGAIYIKP